MEYRKTQALGIIKCSCGTVINKGDYGFVPVKEKDGIKIFERALCRNCKNKKDQDGSFQPDPVARKGGDARMYRNFVDKDSYGESHEHDEAIGKPAQPKMVSKVTEETVVFCPHCNDEEPQCHICGDYFDEGEAFYCNPKKPVADRHTCKPCMMKELGIRKIGEPAVHNPKRVSQ